MEIWANLVTSPKISQHSDVTGEQNYLLCYLFNLFVYLLYQCPYKWHFREISTLAVWVWGGDQLALQVFTKSLQVYKGSKGRYTLFCLPPAACLFAAHISKDQMTLKCFPIDPRGDRCFGFCSDGRIINMMFLNSRSDAPWPFAGSC